MSERKTNIGDLKPGDKVVLRMHSFRELSGSGSNRKRKITARVVAIYPHCIRFQTQYGYMVCPGKALASEMLSGNSYHTDCPASEKVGAEAARRR